MNKQRFLIIIGLLLALGSGYTIINYAAELDQKVPVVVAKKTVEPLDKLSVENLEIIQIPPRCILPGAFTSIQQATGKTAGIKIFPGEQIIPEKLSAGQIAIQPDERLLYLPYQNAQMKPGQRVDVIIVYQPGKSEKTGSEVALRNKVVASVLSQDGASLADEAKSVLKIDNSQAGIEIIATEAEILSYLSELVYAKEMIVRYGEGVNQ